MDSAQVLIVEDNAQDILLAQLLLEELGCSIVIAKTGIEALAILETICPDLVLLDMHLPDMSGIEVCQAIKLNSMLASVPILFVTGSNNPESIVKGFDAGAIDYVVKPFNMSELSSRIKTQIELQQSRKRLIASHQQVLEQTTIIHQQEVQLVENQNLQIKERLEQKNRELTSSLLQLVSFSEMTHGLLVEIQRIANEADPEMALKLASVYSTYRSQMGASNWKEFETRFLQVNGDFIRKIQIDYPTLTSNELKLCAFVSLNLSTKDISAITLQSEESIKKARYRLRKKLGLEEKDSLLSFLSKY